MHMTTSVPHTSGGSFCATAAFVTSITAFHDACILTAFLHYQTSSITKKISKKKEKKKQPHCTPPTPPKILNHEQNFQKRKKENPQGSNQQQRKKSTRKTKPNLTDTTAATSWFSCRNSPISQAPSL